MTNCRSRREIHTSNDDDDIIEILADLIHLAGVIAMDGDNPKRDRDQDQKNIVDQDYDDNDSPDDAWIHLSTSLYDLSKGLNLWVLNNKRENIREGPHFTRPDADDEDGDGDGFYNCSILLEMEESIRHTKNHLNRVDCLIRDNSMYIEECHKLENHRRYDLIPLAKSISTAFQRQKMLARQAMVTVNQQLNQIYGSKTHGDDVLRNLLKVAAILELLAGKFRTRFMKSIKESPWKDAVVLLEKLVSNNDGLSDDDNDDGNDDGQTSCFQLQTLHYNQKAFHHDDHPTTNNSTVIKSTTSNISSILQRSLLQTVEDLLTTQSSDFHSFILLGSEGSGKSYYLSEIETVAVKYGAAVLRPSLPLDVVGSTVGEAEDRLVSMFAWATRIEEPSPQRASLLIFDDIDTVCGSLDSSSYASGSSCAESHSTARLRGLFFNLLDNSRSAATSCGNWKTGTIVICSSKESVDENQSGRFDGVFALTPPTTEERKSFITSCFYGNEDYYNDPDTSSLLYEVAECTEGVSWGGIAQLCRKALSKGLTAESVLQSDGNRLVVILRLLKDELQRSTPDSLKGGSYADSMDLRVFTGKDLQKMYPIANKDNPSTSLPLFGEDVLSAWQDLYCHVVLPLCQGRDLERILYHHGRPIKSQKLCAGGVLLCGPPGSGKTALSYFCAALASALKPSVKLIDVSCTSLIHKEVGGSEKALHRLFQVIQSATPCVVIMDGIENIASPRGNDTTTEGTMDRLLSTLLIELDGVDSNSNAKDASSSGMVLIGITRMESWIDPALRRPGRLERSVLLSFPDHDARRRILLEELHELRYKSQNDYADLSTLECLLDRAANETEGFTGAALVAVCDFAKMQASKEYFLTRSGNMSTSTSYVTGNEPFVTPRLILNAIYEHKGGRQA